MRGDYTEPFGDMVWVTKSVYDENGEVNGAQYLSDLGPALKTAIHRDKRLGQSNQDTIYFRAWRDTAQHSRISNGYWEEEGKVPDAMLRNTNKAKTGQLWHKGKAYLWKMPYMRGGPVATDNLCPLCSQPDSGSHILGPPLGHRQKAQLGIRLLLLRLFIQSVAHRAQRESQTDSQQAHSGIYLLLVQREGSGCPCCQLTSQGVPPPSKPARLAQLAESSWWPASAWCAPPCSPGSAQSHCHTSPALPSKEHRELAECSGSGGSIHSVYCNKTGYTPACCCAAPRYNTF